MSAEGKPVPLSKLCSWLGVPRRTYYYQPRQREHKLDPVLVSKIKDIIEEFPSYGYRMIAAVLKVNRKPVQRVLQLKRW